MKNYICVFDFETDGIDPHNCQPVQVAACMLHPKTLDIVADSYFSSFMRPEGVDTDAYTSNNKTMETVAWHAKNYDTTVSEILKTWREAPEPQQVWQDFANYLLKFNVNQSRKMHFSAPIRAGMNIRRFDNIIADRLCAKYGMVDKDGTQKIFNRRDVVDIMDFCFYWFENMAEPNSYAMDNLRQYFNIVHDDADGPSHDALVDVKDEAVLIQKFFRLHRRLAPTIKFKNSIGKYSV